MISSRQKAKNLARKTILHIISGSIAAYKAGDLIQELRESGARTVCILTEAAKKFVTPLTVRALSGEPVYHDFFSPDTEYAVLHTSLAEQADLILVAPASANFIARLAAGLADDLASCTVLASQAPVVIVPAMNDQMYRNPITQSNIQKLMDLGYQFVLPVEGHLVCGKEAIGHIAANETIIQLAERVLMKKSHRLQR